MISVQLKFCVISTWIFIGTVSLPFLFSVFFLFLKWKLFCLAISVTVPCLFFIQRLCFPALSFSVLLFKGQSKCVHFWAPSLYSWLGQMSAEWNEKNQVSYTCFINTSSKTLHWLTSVIFWNLKMGYSINLWTKK